MIANNHESKSGSWQVVKLLEKRASHFFATGERLVDGLHLALVIEGGGMRAVFAAGMAEAIQQEKLHLFFDSVHGSSAGALIAAYLTAEQASVSADIFCEEAASIRFINPFRIFSSRPIMDLRWMIHTIFKKIRPLDTIAILEKQGHLTVVATSTISGSEVSFSHFDSGDEVLEALEASAFLPIIAGRSAAVAGQNLVDGGIAQRIPLKSAIERGATHVMLLLTQRWQDRETRRTLKEWFETNILRIFYGRALAVAYRERNRYIEKFLTSLNDAGAGSCEGVSLQIVAPATDDVPPTRLTTDRQVLLSARRAGRRAVQSLMSIHGDE